MIQAIRRTLKNSPDRAPGVANLPVTIVRPSKGWVPLRLHELWEYRETLYFLAWRDIKVRYKQTVLGATWAIIQPFFTMVVFSFVFGKLARVPSEGVPYPIFAYSALVPWMYFANALTHASASLVEQERMITKVFFPRLIIPMAAMLAGLLDFAIAFIVLLGLMAYYGLAPTAAVLTLPFFVLLATATALGAGLWLSALNVHYRDVQYAVPFVIQLWLFVTPVAYPSSLVHGPGQVIFSLNPMAGVVEGFRWALLGKAGAASGPLAISVLVVVVLLISGLYYFRRMERTFADVV